jgi:PAS domain S-box-containing protein
VPAQGPFGGGTPALSLDGLLDPILAATNDGVMDWDVTRGTIAYSDRWKALLGYEAHELVDTPSLWQDLSHPDDRAEAASMLREHIESLWPFAHTWRMLHKNGDWRWSLCRAVTLQGPDNAPSRCVCVFTDVTDQVLAEKRLSELTHRIELLLNSAGEGFLGIDEQANITFANPAAAEMLGYANAATAVGKKLGDALVHGCPPGLPCHPASCPILRPFSSGEANRVLNGAFGRPGGASFTADYVSTPARDQNRVVGLVLTFRDVTEQRRMESQRMQGQKLEALGQLAAGIAHEINTPMQYVGDNIFFLNSAFADMLTLVGQYKTIVDDLKMDPAKADLVDRASTAEDAADIAYLSESVPKAIAATQDGIGRVRKIVIAMKEFSHPGRSEKGDENLNHAIESTLTISANVWKHAANLETAFDPDLPLVHCHLGEINQVVLNLIVNAAHAIDDYRTTIGPEAPLGTLRVETGVRNGYAEIRITDTGGGIPEHVQHRLFEPFFTTKEVGRGTGQGLTLARSIVVEHHNGFVDFTTAAGKGTTFVVGLPMHAGNR